MALWLVIGATVIALLIGGLIMSEYLYRRGHGRHSIPWSDDEPAPPRSFHSKSDELNLSSRPAAALDRDVRPGP